MEIAMKLRLLISVSLLALAMSAARADVYDDAIVASRNLVQDNAALQTAAVRDQLTGMERAAREISALNAQIKETDGKLNAANDNLAKLKAQQSQLESDIANNPLQQQARMLVSIENMRDVASKAQQKSEEAARMVETLKSQNVPASDMRMKTAIAQRDRESIAANAFRNAADAMVRSASEQVKLALGIDDMRDIASKAQQKLEEAARMVETLKSQNVPASDMRMKTAIAQRDRESIAANAFRNAADAMVRSASEQVKHLVGIDDMRDIASKAQQKSEEAARMVETLKSQNVPASDLRMQTAIAQRDRESIAANAFRNAADAMVASTGVDDATRAQLASVRAGIAEAEKARKSLTSSKTQAENTIQMKQDTIAGLSLLVVAAGGAQGKAVLAQSPALKATVAELAARTSKGNPRVAAALQKMMSGTPMTQAEARLIADSAARALSTLPATAAEKKRMTSTTFRVVYSANASAQASAQTAVAPGAASTTATPSATQAAASGSGSAVGGGATVSGAGKPSQTSTGTKPGASSVQPETTSIVPPRPEQATTTTKTTPTITTAKPSATSGTQTNNPLLQQQAKPQVAVPPKPKPAQPTLASSPSPTIQAPKPIAPPVATQSKPHL
jgi:uncharacterized protein YqgV (UPF0045/DUF77 family)